MNLFSDFWKKINKYLLTLVSDLCWLKKKIIRVVKKSYRSFSSIFPVFQRKKLTKKLKSNPVFTTALLLLVLCLTFVGGFLITININFEGKIFVNTINFTYSGQPDRLFLNSIPHLQKIDILGQQGKITLSGKFSNVCNSNFTNEKLEIELNLPESRIIIEPQDINQLSQIHLNQLRIQPETKIKNLNYDSFRNTLNLSLESWENNQNSLAVSLGRNPLKVFVEHFNLPQISNEECDTLDFTFFPSSSTELYLASLNSTELFLNLPPSQTNQRNWFWHDLDVKNVQFTKLNETGDLNDTVKISTVLQGQIRMKNKNMELEEDQFLELTGKPGIINISSLQISPQEPQGLKVSFSGKANTIEIGLNPELPVKKIKAIIWDRFLPSEIINFLLTFSGVGICYILPWLFTQK